MPADTIRVLVVDDDVLNASAHAEYVRRLTGFAVAGIAHSGNEALRLLQSSLRDAASDDSIDLILLDMNLPDLRGIEVCRRIRASGVVVDVIAVTAVRDVALVREAMSLGILLYLMKPFTFAAFADKLHRYRDFRVGFVGDGTLASQAHVDRAMANLRNPTHLPLEKGLTQETLDRVAQSIPTGGEAVSATQLALKLGTSRVTARRYLEHLVSAALLEKTARYGMPGRPEFEYRKRGSTGAN